MSITFQDLLPFFHYMREGNIDEAVNVLYYNMTYADVAYALKFIGFKPEGEKILGKFNKSVSKDNPDVQDAYYITAEMYQYSYIITITNIDSIERWIFDYSTQNVTHYSATKDNPDIDPTTVLHIGSTEDSILDNTNVSVHRMSDYVWLEDHPMYKDLVKQLFRYANLIQ